MQKKIIQIFNKTTVGRVVTAVLLCLFLGNYLDDDTNTIWIEAFGGGVFFILLVIYSILLLLMDKKREISRKDIFLVVSAFVYIVTFMTSAAILKEKHDLSIIKEHILYPLLLCMAAILYIYFFISKYLCYYEKEYQVKVEGIAYTYVQMYFFIIFFWRIHKRILQVSRTFY